LVRVVPDVPAGMAGPAPRAARAVTVVREPGRAQDDLVHDTVTPDVLPSDLQAHDDERVRDVHPTSGAPDERPVEALLDEVAEHDTVVLGRGTGEVAEDEDPRARIPAWEDIVFGVRRHR
jgi:hypothetical protein